MKSLYLQRDLSRGDKTLAAVLARGHAGDTAKSEPARGPAEKVKLRLDAYLGCRIALSSAGEDHLKAQQAKDGLHEARLDLLEMVPVMEWLHSRGEETKEARDALNALHQDAKELMNANPDLRGRAEILLARMEAREYVDSLLRRDDLGPGQKLPILVDSLGEVSLLVGDSVSPPSAAMLAHRALEMVIESSRDIGAEHERAVLAARIMLAGRMALTVPPEMADGARANLASLVGKVASFTGTTGRSLREREAAILKLAGAYGDMVVLDSVLRKNPTKGADPDRDLMISALAIVIASPPDIMKKAAAALLMEGQKPKKG
jgi:hypothetical protein